MWLNINGEGTLKKEIKDFNIISICDYESIRDKHKIPLNKNLIPYISREKLDFIAQDFLKKFYPDGLEGAIYVNPRIIAKRLNLNICKHSISKDKSILGRIFFEDVISSFYDNLQYFNIIQHLSICESKSSTFAFFTVFFISCLYLNLRQILITEKISANTDNNIPI